MSRPKKATLKLVFCLAAIIAQSKITQHERRCKFFAPHNFRDKFVINRAILYFAAFGAYKVGMRGYIAVVTVHLKFSRNLLNLTGTLQLV
jgi:hypothetical protein